MSNIVGLRGEAIAAPGEVNPEVVEIAEQLLDMARSGDIKSLFAFVIHSDETVSALERGNVTYRLIGVITLEIHEMCAAMD